MQVSNIVEPLNDPKLLSEQIVVGMCVGDQKNLERCLTAGLRPEHFVDGGSARVFMTLLDLDRKSLSLDLMAILAHSPDLILVAQDCEDKRSIAQNVEYYAEQVKRGYWCREHAMRFSRFASQCAAHDSSDDIDQLLAAKAELAGLCEQEIGSSDDDSSVASMYNEWESYLEQRVVDFRNGKAPGFPTGLKRLDLATCGFCPSALYILAARPAMGKTTLALNFSYEVAKAGHKVGFFTIEMDAKQVLNKLVSRDAGLSGSKIKAGNLSDDDVGKVLTSGARIRDMPLYIFDRFGGRLESMITIIRRMHRKKKLDMAVVDYIQLLSPDGRFENKNAEVGKISKALKSLAQELKIPILALSQINREYEKNPDAPPTMRNLKDSGSLEQDADSAYAIWRSDGMTFLRIMKNREGMSDFDIAVNADNEINRWTELGETCR